MPRPLRPGATISPKRPVTAGPNAPPPGAKTPPGAPDTFTAAKATARTPSTDELEALVDGRHGDPHTVLGAHRVEVNGQPETAFRALFPPGKDLTLVAQRRGTPQPEVKVAMVLEGGVYRAQLPGEDYDYHFEELSPDGSVRKIEDPYRFPPTISQTDLYLFKEGTLEDTADFLGAHELTVDGVKGFNYVVWAPNARAVSVVGDFDDWNPAAQPMRRLGESVWEVFLPERKAGEVYKFSILDSKGERVLKSDPAGRRFELRPKNASITVGKSDFAWHDQEWLKVRAAGGEAERPVSIYELHLPSWRRGPNGEMLSAREAADQLVTYVKQQGFTHLEVLGLAEHPFDGSWGYQVTGYYAPTARLGTPEDFKYLVDRLHEAGVGVLFDWVPAHFPKDSFGLNEFDGTHLYDYEDDRIGAHLDWGTRVFNYERPEVRSFLIGNLMHMIDEYHLDGARVDAVASMLYRDYSRTDWIPNVKGGKENLEAIEFLKTVNRRVEARFPGILTVAEELTAFPKVTAPVEQGGLGFDLKWNMGWMNDTLEFFKLPAGQRGQNLDRLTNTLLWAQSEKYVLALSHDEVVHLKKSLLEKMPGDDAQKFANLRLLYSYMLAYPGDKLLFMGDEFGQRQEWNEAGQLSWEMLKADLPAGLSKLVAEVNRLYRSEPALNEKQFESGGSETVVRDPTNAVVGILRKGVQPADDVLLVSNFTPTARQQYRIGVDRPGSYDQILSSESAAFGGSDAGIPAPVVAEAAPLHGKPYSISVTLPPLSTVAFKRAG